MAGRGNVDVLLTSEQYERLGGRDRRFCDQLAVCRSQLLFRLDRTGTSQNAVENVNTYLGPVGGSAQKGYAFNVYDWRHTHPSNASLGVGGFLVEKIKLLHSTAVHFAYMWCKWLDIHWALGNP